MWENGVNARAAQGGGVATVVFYSASGAGQGEVERGVAGVAGALEFVLR